MKNTRNLVILSTALIALLVSVISAGCSSQSAPAASPAQNLKALAAGTPPAAIAAQIAAEQAAAKQPINVPAAPPQALKPSGQ